MTEQTSNYTQRMTIAQAQTESFARTAEDSKQRLIDQIERLGSNIGNYRDQNPEYVIDRIIHELNALQSDARRAEAETIRAKTLVEAMNFLTADQEVR